MIVLLEIVEQGGRPSVGDVIRRRQKSREVKEERCQNNAIISHSKLLPHKAVYLILGLFLPLPVELATLKEPRAMPLPRVPIVNFVGKAKVTFDSRFIFKVSVRKSSLML